MIAHGVEISLAGAGEEMVPGLSHCHFFSFLLFCNHTFIVLRYKKPHAALSIQRTKPIKQTTQTKESHDTKRLPLSGRFLIIRATSHVKRKAQTSQYFI